MKKVLLFACILLLPLTIISQTPFIEPSWDLMPSDGPTINTLELIPMDIVETQNDSYFVSLIYDLGLPFDKKTREKNNIARIVKLDNNGEILQKIELEYEKDYFVNDMKFDIWNDTISVFTLLTSIDGSHFVLMHAYLFDDFSTSKHKEIWRKEFDDGLVWRNVMGKLDPLIDEKGCRTFHFQYSTSMLAKDTIVFFIKLDSKFNVISEYEYDLLDDLNNAILANLPLMYNADSTQYYYVSYTPEYPYYYFMNVLDMEFDLVEQVPLESKPKIDLQSLVGYWCQNPYDGKIYAIGLVSHPNIKSEIGAFKTDVDSGDVDFLRLSYSSNEIKNSIIIHKNLCFLPDGKIIGGAVYDMDLFNQYKPNSMLCYIPVFDTNMKKQTEWYYTIGEIYNHYMYRIEQTKDNGVVLMGYIRYMMDNEIYWEPYIVKFPASAFDTENIEEAHAHGLHLAVAYPNPGGDVMNIRTGLRNAVLSVYDINGRKIHEQEITEDVTSVDASAWNSGTYVWKLGMRNEELGIKEIETGKWIK